jgi:hypothetical protein
MNPQEQPNTVEEVLRDFREVCFKTRDDLYNNRQVSISDLQIATEKAKAALDLHYYSQALAAVPQNEDLKTTAWKPEVAYAINMQYERIREALAIQFNQKGKDENI